MTRSEALRPPQRSTTLTQGAQGAPAPTCKATAAIREAQAYLEDTASWRPFLMPEEVMQERLRQLKRRNEALESLGHREPYAPTHDRKYDRGALQDAVVQALGRNWVGALVVAQKLNHSSSPIHQALARLAAAGRVEARRVAGRREYRRRA